RRIIGAHLRTRLVGAFVGVALLPATLLFLVALVFVGNSIERWFNEQVENSLAGSREIAQTYYRGLGETALGFARGLAERLHAEGLLAPERRDTLKRFVDQRRAEYQLDVVEVFARGQAVARSRRSELPGGIGLAAWSDLVRRVGHGLATVVVLFAATWVGFYIARRITVPIQRLAEGTRAVAQGDLDQRIPGEGHDEIGTLVTAFNRMTAELKTSRTELDSRRRYLEI